MTSLLKKEQKKAESEWKEMLINVSKIKKGRVWHMRTSDWKSHKNALKTTSYPSTKIFCCPIQNWASFLCDRCVNIALFNFYMRAVWFWGQRRLRRIHIYKGRCVYTLYELRKIFEHDMSMNPAQSGYMFWNRKIVTTVICGLKNRSSTFSLGPEFFAGYLICFIKLFTTKAWYENI